MLWETISLQEYYYRNEAGEKVYLKTVNGNPLVKNKYWTRYLVNSDDSQRYPDHGAGVTTIPAGIYRTNTNPLTGSVVEGWLEEAVGKDVFVTVTVLSNGEVRTQTESVTLPEPPDSIRPVVTVTSDIKEYNNQDFSIDVEATDAETGLKKVVINLYDQNGFLAPCVNTAGEGAATKSVSCDIDVDELGDGEFYIKTNARDEADNMSRTVTQGFKIDISDPTVDIDNPENGMILPGNFDISGTWEDAFSGIDFIRVWINRKIDGSFAGRVVNDQRAQVNGDGTFLYEAKNIPSGNYDLKINGVDKAGNDDFASNVNVTVDADSPEVSSVVVNGMNVEDTDLRGANCQDIANTYKVNGDLNFSATLNDEVSGVSNARYRIRKLNSNGCTMSSVYSSGQMNLEYDSETDRWANTAAFDTRTLEDGVYTIMMITRDAVGNQSVTYADIEVDNTYPTITDVTYLREGVEATVFAPGDQMTIRVTTEDANDVTQVQYWARKYPWDRASQLSAGNLVEVSENVWEVTILVPETYTNGGALNEAELGNYVNFRPYDELGNSHIGWRENFTIDATGPETTITGPQDGFNTNEPVTITGITTDPNGVAKVTIEARAEGETEYTIPVAEVTDFESDGSWSYTWTPDSEGLYDLRAYGEDSLGNLEMTDYIDNLVYDLTPPSVPELLSPRNMWIQGKAALTNTWSSVTDNLSDSITYLYRSERTSESVNPGSVWQGEYGATSKTASASAISGMNGHIFDWMVRAVDAAGNMSDWSESRTVIIDTEAPELTVDPITSPSNTSTISGTALDENGVRRVLIHYKEAGTRGRGTLLDREYVEYDSETGEWTANLPIEESGDYVIMVKARDIARPFNDSEQQTFEVSYDFDAPTKPETIQIFQNDNDVSGGLLKESSRDVTVDWSDVEDANFAYYEYETDSGWKTTVTQSERSGKVGSNSPVDGKTYSYRVRGVDQFDQKGQWSDWVEVTLDLSNPTISLESPADGQTYSLEALLRGSVEDVNLDSVKYTITGPEGEVVNETLVDLTETNVSIDETVNISDLTNGEYVLYVNATDKAGNESEKTINVVVDNSIAGIVNTTPEVSTLKTALETAELFGTFESGSEKNYTVFAPVNSAFDGFDIPQLLANPELATILTYHVVEETVLAGDLSDGQEITTLSGKKLFVLFEDDKVFLEDENGGKVEIIQTDIEATNGVIHLIGSVLLPNDQGPEKAGINGTPTNEDETEYETGATIDTPEDVTVRVLKDREDYDYDQEVGLDEPGVYEIITIDRFGRETSRTITIVEPASEEGGDSGSESEEQETSVPNETPATNNELDSNNSGAADQNDSEDTPNQETNQDSDPVDVLEGTGGSAEIAPSGGQVGQVFAFVIE